MWMEGKKGKLDNRGRRANKFGNSKRSAYHEAGCADRCKRQIPQIEKISRLLGALPEEDETKKEIDSLRPQKVMR